MTDMPMLVNKAAEEYVIGSVLISGTAVYPSLRDMLSARHFWHVRYRTYWQAFDRLMDKGDIIELTNTVEELRLMGVLDEMHDYVELLRLIGQVENSYHAPVYAREVYDMAIRRDAAEKADRLRQDALNMGLSTEAMALRFDRAAVDLQHDLGRLKASHVTMDTFTTDLLEMLVESEARYKENPEYVVGVRTGVRDLDLMLDGLRPGITTLAAATGVGKTSLALQIVRYASRHGLLRRAPAPARVHFFSGEMTQRQLGARLLSSMTGVPVRHIERGSYSAQQKGLLEDALHDIDMTQLTLEPGARLNTAQLRQRVRQMVMDNALDLLVLDGLLQIEAVKVDVRDSKERQSYMKQQRRDLIEEVMNDLEALALTYNLPILLTHQISRAPNGRADKRPILSDLAEASFVEQKSAVILFLYRDVYYNEHSMNGNAAEIICRKNRFGSTGTVHQLYDAQFTRFIDADVERLSLGA